MTESRHTLDGFAAGWAVFHGERAAEYFPPLNDMEAQRCWLGGFGAAWAEHPDRAAAASFLEGDGSGSEGVEEALPGCWPGGRSCRRACGRFTPDA
jgi:hypothetical protein